MTWVTGVVLYIIVWWTVLFTMLPIGVKVPSSPAPGVATSAPENPRLGRKIVWTSLLSIVIWLLIYGVVNSGLISLGETTGAPSVY